MYFFKFRNYSNFGRRIKRGDGKFKDIWPYLNFNNSFSVLGRRVKLRGPKSTKKSYICISATFDIPHLKGLMGCVENFM